MECDLKRSDLLPAGTPNPIVWCERCQRHHRYHTFTQEDYDRVISDGAKALADFVEAEALRLAYPK